MLPSNRDAICVMGELAVIAAHSPDVNWDTISDFPPECLNLAEFGWDAKEVKGAYFAQLYIGENS
jgi:hypothetical protein